MPDLTVVQEVDDLMAAQTVDAMSDRTTLLMSEDFTGTSINSAIRGFNTTPVFDQANNRLEVNSNNAGHGVWIDLGSLGGSVGDYYAVELVWSRNSNTIHSIECRSSWNDATLPRAAYPDDAAPVGFLHRQSATNLSTDTDSLLFRPLRFENDFSSPPYTWYITKIRIWKAEPLYQSQESFIVGTGLAITQPANEMISLGNRNQSGDGDKEILIGNDIFGSESRANEHNIGIGNNTNLRTATDIGSDANSNGDRLSVGDGGSAESWRATNLGAQCRTRATSGATVGWGGYNEIVHGNGFGRGVLMYNSQKSLLQNNAVLTSNIVYLSNLPAHRADAPPNGSSIGETSAGVDPTTVTCGVYGKWAGDIRATPSDTNVGGGICFVGGGAGTGNAPGGSATLRVAPGGASGAQQNPHVDALEAKPLANGAVEFLVRETQSGTAKRLVFNPDNSVTWENE